MCKNNLAPPLASLDTQGDNLAMCPLIAKKIKQPTCGAAT